MILQQSLNKHGELKRMGVWVATSGERRRAEYTVCLLRLGMPGDVTAAILLEPAGIFSGHAGLVLPMHKDA